MLGAVLKPALGVGLSLSFGLQFLGFLLGQLAGLVQLPPILHLVLDFRERREIGWFVVGLPIEERRPLNRLASSQRPGLRRIGDRVLEQLTGEILGLRIAILSVM